MVAESEAIHKETHNNWFWECSVRETIWGNPFNRESRSYEEGTDKTKLESIAESVPCVLCGNQSEKWWMMNISIIIKFEAHFDLDFGGMNRIIISYIPMQTDP